MKKLLYTVLTAALLLSLMACDNESHSEAEVSSPGTSASPSQENNGNTVSRFVTRMTVYGPNNEVCYWHEYEYGPDGKRISITSYGPFNNENGHIDFTYDEEGNRNESYTTLGVNVGIIPGGGVTSPKLEESTSRVVPTINVSIPNEYDAAGNLKKGFTMRVKKMNIIVNISMMLLGGA